MRLLNRILLQTRPSLLASLVKRALGIRRRVVATSAGRFFVDPASIFGNTLLSQLEYEPEVRFSLRTILRAGDTFLDVGANEGYFSILASQIVGSSGCVISVEPQSRLQSVLRQNLIANSADNVHIHQIAVSDRDGTARLYLAPHVNTGSSGIFRNTRYPNPSELVPQTTLGTLLHNLNLNAIRLLKIDIEGFEYEAILGSEQLFRSGIIEFIALELHPTILQRRGKSVTPILKLLRDCGYLEDRRFKNLVLRKTAEPTLERAAQH